MEGLTVTLTAMIDQLSEQLEQQRQTSLAAVLDTVSEELEQRLEETDETGKCEATASTVHASDATNVLKSSAERLFDAVKQYGAQEYTVTADGIRIVLDRGDVKTETAFAFHSQDEDGRPQLRVTFTCGNDRMVRWASLESITGETLTRAATHVFGTGENYGPRVVTASTPKKRVSASYQVIDAIEQRVHEAAAGKTYANTSRALRPYRKSLLRKALPLLDSWTARHVARHVKAK